MEACEVSRWEPETIRPHAWDESRTLRPQLPPDIADIAAKVSPRLGDRSEYEKADWGRMTEVTISGVGPVTDRLSGTRNLEDTSWDVTAFGSRSIASGTGLRNLWQTGERLERGDRLKVSAGFWS